MWGCVPKLNQKMQFDWRNRKKKRSIFNHKQHFFILLLLRAEKFVLFVLLFSRFFIWDRTELSTHNIDNWKKNICVWITSLSISIFGTCEFILSTCYNSFCQILIYVTFHERTFLILLYMTYSWRIKGLNKPLCME